jgi:hypothetical protein
MPDSGSGLIVHGDCNGAARRLLAEKRRAHEQRNREHGNVEDLPPHCWSITRKKFVVSLATCRSASSLLAWAPVKGEWLL